VACLAQLKNAQSHMAVQIATSYSHDAVREGVMSHLGKYGYSSVAQILSTPFQELNDIASKILLKKYGFTK
jgi:hypothetical protein